MYYPEIKKDESLYEVNTQDNDISSIIQLKNGIIAVGHYNKKIVSFYQYNFKKITEKNSISTQGYVTCLCDVNNKAIAVGNYSPNIILLYDISENVNKEIKKLEGHSGRFNSIIDLNDNYLVSGGQGSYEIFIWEKKNNYNLQKLTGHSSNINCIIKLDRNNYYASCSDDKTIRIWNNLSNIRTISCNNAVKQIIQLKNKKIVCADSGRNICIFNENNYSNERTFSSEHSSNITKIIQLKDLRILTCSDDKQMKLLEPNNYKCLNYSISFTLKNDSNIKTILQTENYQIISGDSNGFLKVWTPQLFGNCMINYCYKADLFNDSVIVNNDEKEMISNWINSDKKIQTELLYRLTRDGDTPQAFHSRCDGKGTTIIFIKNYSNGYRFGGFTTVPWKGNNTYQQDPKAFVFSLNNRKKFPIKNPNDGNAVGHYSDYGPIFGSDTDIYFHSGGNWSLGENASCRGNNYNCTVLELIDVDSSSSNFRVSDFEVWLIK